jgi:hypothetical protein
MSTVLFLPIQLFTTHHRRLIESPILGFPSARARAPGTQYTVLPAFDTGRFPFRFLARLPALSFELISWAWAWQVASGKLTMIQRFNGQPLPHFRRVVDVVSMRIFSRRTMQSTGTSNRLKGITSAVKFKWLGKLHQRQDLPWPRPAT